NIEKVFGYKKEEIIGQSFNKFPLFSKEHKAIVLKSLSKLMKGEIPETQELQLHKKDGSIIWVSMQPSIVKLKNETLFQVITQDISKIKEAELKLKKSEERYRLLFESSPIGIGIADFEGNVQGINNAMEKITGFSLEEYKKINLSSTYVDPHDRSKMLDVLKSKGRVRNYEVQLKRFDESKYQALLNIELEEIENEKYIIISVQDITELKLAEEKLKDLNKLKSELLRRTSHELKTPLVSIKGFSDLLLELHREQLDDYILNTIEEIKKGCIRLETLISDILKTAELESDVVQINKLEEDISFLIKLCNNELKGLSQLRNLKINLNIPDRLIASFEKEQLHQVISNLLNNAIKYTPPHGNIEIKSEIKDNLLIFSIKDSGIGLTEEERGRIFKQFGKVERFGQGYDVMSEGSGLGLYISKKIIELHGGEIWVESEGRNKGTTFYFSLPIEDNRSKEEQKFEEFK
ncbi:MAG: PAS domain-containing sensor histidine kinase, partial [Candidatus Lokiarchaeota archaeon]|nr:PAS domain-containing sensor histidine kinase [Candidatus Lokiarchaeota archaeon]